MSKALLLVFCCVLVGCLASPYGLDSWLRDRIREWRPRGCGDRLAAREACGDNSTELAAHPRDCRLFFYCRGAAPPVCRRCPFGLHFNPELQVCDWPQNANCTVRPPPTKRPRPWPPAGSSTTNASTSAAPGSTVTPDNIDAPSSPSTDAAVSTTDSPSSNSTGAPPSTITEELPYSTTDSTESPSTYDIWRWGRK